MIYWPVNSFGEKSKNPPSLATRGTVTNSAELSRSTGRTLYRGRRGQPDVILEARAALIGTERAAEICNPFRYLAGLGGINGERHVRLEMESAGVNGSEHVLRGILAGFARLHSRRLCSGTQVIQRHGIEDRSGDDGFTFHNMFFLCYGLLRWPVGHCLLRIQHNTMRLEVKFYFSMPFVPAPQASWRWRGEFTGQ